MLEKEFGGNVVTAGYIGSRGDRLVTGKNFNLAPAAAGAVDPRRPLYAQYPGISAANVLTNLGKSTYNAAQFVFTRRYRAGLSMTSHYTWAHARSLTLVPWDTSILEWGDTVNFDVRHRWVMTTNYELPWGKSLTGLAHGFLSSWQVNASAFWQSGVAFTVVNAASRTNTGGTDRPIVTGDPNLPSSEQTVQRWFDTSAFSQAPLYAGGNIGPALMHGPNQRQVNFSIFKDLAITGQQRLQLRAEIYNLLNSANFGLPDPNYGSTGFGSISSTGNSIPRQMQFGVKYLF